jgi:surface polysaccharide O-acyltransferase-like enzyme
MAREGSGRVAYADLLRVFAATAVIVLHVSGGWLGAVSVVSSDFVVLNLWDGLCRWCVPVFVMLSGMFLLDPKHALSPPSLLRHMLRLAAAFVFWGMFYLLLHRYLESGSVSLTDWSAAFHSLLRGNTEQHLWFLPMMLGLYLITPVLRAFVQGARQGSFLWFFLLTAVFTFILPTLLALRPSQTLSLWYGRLQLHLVLGYVGYYVLGYYLQAFTINRFVEYLIYLCGVLGAVGTVWGTLILSRRAGGLVDTLYSYFSPNVAAMAVAVLVLSRYVLGVSDERSRREHLSRAAAYSFGVYLVHVAFLLLLREHGLSTPSVGPLAGVPLVSLAILIPSFFVSWLLHHIPLVGRYLT